MRFLFLLLALGCACSSIDAAGKQFKCDPSTGIDCLSVEEPGAEHDAGCVAKTCQELGLTCGGADDGSGSTLDCGTCVTSCEAGQHVCSNQCVSDSSIASCGSSCVPCRTSPLGTTACEEGSCRLECGGGTFECGRGCCPPFKGSETISTRIPDWLSIVVTTDGHLEAGLYDESSGDLVHLSNEGGLWREQVVDSDGNVGDRHAFVVDAAGTPHFAYRDETNRALKYAVRVDGQWKSQVVEASGDKPSLVLDSTGRPHIAFLLPSSVRYAVRDGAGWSLETIAGRSSDFVSLSLDAKDTPHVFYGEGAGLYATREAGSWPLQEVFAKLNTTYRTEGRIAVDSNGSVHLAIWLSSSIQYAEGRPGQWTYEKLRTTDNSSHVSLSMGLDDGAPVLSYFPSWGVQRVMVQRRAESRWSREDVGVSSSRSALGIGPSGRHALIYRSFDNRPKVIRPTAE
jgi:hypothetical protein